ncbi:MAG: type II toxin-antitoxin system VapC family toxin [Candidatus Methanoperedens sp.]|nr:type II toxin-antitoxin system VapC family toxin [Candidatus Methanoperedens sp.]MCE8429102.1 type II toxin-antitoxin system VapC family toxin [Candidatus Methanoperedens sp.]
MTVFDTNFLIDLLRGKPGTSEIADLYEHPKTTTINAFELYYGARRSSKPEKSVYEVNLLLKSIDVLGLDIHASQKAAEIYAVMMNSGKTLDVQDVLIAGIVMENNDELVTRDINHFSRIPGLKCSSW